MFKKSLKRHYLIKLNFMSKSIIKIFNFIFLVLTALLYRVDYCALLLRAGV